MSHRAKCQIEVAFETHISGLACGDRRRGSKEDLIVIVNNTKTHRPTIMLGSTREEERTRYGKNSREGNLTWNKSYTLYVYSIVFFRYTKSLIIFIDVV